jgi:nitroreductase
MDFDKVIDTRHSVKSFATTKKVDYKKIIESVNSANKAPLAGNYPSVFYIVVQDKEKIKKLAEASVQDFFEDVNFAIVVCSDYSFLKKSYYDRGNSYGKQQAGAAIENLLLKITEQGLSACWIGAFTDNIVKETLRIPEEIEIEAIIPIGYELGKGKQKTKPDLDRVMFFDTWKNKFMKPKDMVPSTKT